MCNDGMSITLNLGPTKIKLTRTIKVLGLMFDVVSRDDNGSGILGPNLQPQNNSVTLVNQPLATLMF